MMSDNLASLFPHTSMNFGGLHLDCHKIFSITATLVVLPTVWLRDLTLLSYISGFLSLILIISHASSFCEHPLLKLYLADFLKLCAQLEE